MDERAKKKSKLKVSFAEVWRPINKLIQEARREIREME